MASPRRSLVVLSFLLAVNFVFAQSSADEFKSRHRTEFEKFRTEKRQEFKVFRDSVNALYGRQMRAPWKEIKAEPEKPVPPSPEPPTPIVADPDEEPSNDPLPFKSVSPLPKPLPHPVPLLPNRETPKPQLTKREIPSIPTPVSTPLFSFDFYGTSCEVPFNPHLKFSFRNIDENAVADAWDTLSSDESIPLVESLVGIRNNLGLSDWSYLKLVEKFANEVYHSNNNESKVLQMFLLTQSGYKVRIGRMAENIVLLVPSDNTIYNRMYLVLDGTTYYVTERVKVGGIKVFNNEFPREQSFSLNFSQQPSLAFKNGGSRHIRSKHNAAIDMDVEVNHNLIDLYNEYPLLSGQWNMYASASLSTEVKKQLYPILLREIEGKSEQNAANILLHFVQTAFQYKTDDEQFGYERSFFPDETFFYPYSDCEDRAILYSVLVRDLLGLDVVLVHYPGHLATAVRFSEPVRGDYFNIDGNTFTVCDPTYINSNVGMAMPRYRNSDAEIIKL